LRKKNDLIILNIYHLRTALYSEAMSLPFTGEQNKEQIYTNQAFYKNQFIFL